MPDFILQKEGLFTQEYCDKAIEAFEKAADAGNVISRQANNEGNRLRKNDNASFLIQETEPEVLDLIPQFNKVFWSEAYPEYAEQFAILNDCDPHKIWTHKLQKTLPREGYHVWHTENMGRNSCNRLLTYILYLNDVEEGGETEFLYYGKRIKPTTGTLLLWPAGFTHVHRGNPPLSGEKYIMTGWVEY